MWPMEGSPALTGHEASTDTGRGNEPRTGVMRGLALDAAAIEVVGALRARGVRPILIKGPSTARWLYADRPGQRVYGDIDLLVAPGQFEPAMETLAGLGYHNRTPGYGLDEPLVHAYHWVRHGPHPAEIDLHRRLYLLRAGDDAVWSALTEHTETLALGAAEVEILGAPARALMLTLHATVHGVRTGKPLRDLARALERLGDEDWAQAATLAGRLGGADAFSAGLRLLDAGSALADRLHLPPAASARVHLRAATAPPAAVGLLGLLEPQSWHSRANRLRRELIPAPAFIARLAAGGPPGPGGTRRRLPVAAAVAVVEGAGGGPSGAARPAAGAGWESGQRSGRLRT